MFALWIFINDDFSFLATFVFLENESIAFKKVGLISMFKMYKFKEDIYPTTFIIAGFIFLILPYLYYNNLTVFLAIIGIILRILVPIHQHYHSHLSTFKSSSLNSLYDYILSVSGGSLTSMWKAHHGLGHHVDYLDQKNDVEGNLRFGVNIPFRRLVFTVFGSNLSLLDSFKILNKYNSKYSKQLKIKMWIQLFILIFTYLILFSINWKLTLLIVYIPNFFLKAAVFWFSYGQHDNLPITSIYDSSTTKVSLNQILLNVGLHTAHHEKPGMHWSLLPQRTNTIKNLIHPVCLRM